MSKGRTIFFPVLLIFALIYNAGILTAQVQDIEDAQIRITFAAPPDVPPQVAKAWLKYDKEFALILQVANGSKDLYTKVYPYFKGVDGNQGLFYSDGVSGTRPFTMSSIQFSETNGNDVHEPGTNYLTWEQIKTLWNDNYGIGSRGFEAPTDPLYPYYEVNRNLSYTRRMTYPDIEHGIMMDIYAIPTWGDSQIQIAKQAGHIAVYDESPAAMPNPLKAEILNTFEYKEFTRDEIGTDLYKKVTKMAKRSSKNAHYLATFYCNGFDSGNNISFEDFKGQMDSIANDYGANGSDRIWVASATEIFEYLIMREKIDIETELDSNVLTITFLTNSFPKNYRWYSLTLNIKADTTITDITVSDGFLESMKFDGDSALINLDWDGSDIDPIETTTQQAINLAFIAPNKQNCLIAQDYVFMLQDPDSLDKYQQMLCGICTNFLPGICTFEFDIPDDTICKGGSVELSAPDNLRSYLWSTGDTTQSITVSPDTTTLYWVEAINQDYNAHRDTVTVFVVSLDSINHSPDTIYNPPGNDTTLWVQYIEGYSYLWNTGETDTAITISPEVTTNYYVDIETAECTLRLNFFVIADFEYHVDFTYDTVCYGDTTLLVNTAVSNDSALLVSWDLNSDGVFDDAEGDTVKYVYSEYGLVLTGMRITYTSGNMKLAYHSVPVADPPHVWFGYSGICSPNTSTNFSDSTQVIVGEPVSWYWDYGDSDFDVGKYVSHRYNPGIYNTKLTVTSTYGCIDSAIREIQIYENPDFDLLREDDTKVYNGDTVFFPNGGSAYLKVQNPTLFDSIIWPDGSNAPDFYLSQEGHQTVFVYQNVCSSYNDFVGAVQGGYIPPSPGDTASIMNLFTPNGDGFNDVWVVNNKNVKFPIKVNIYTRYGNLVYSSEDYQNDWNGYFNGNILPKGTYYYVIQDANGKIFKGPLTIIR